MAHESPDELRAKLEEARILVPESSLYQHSRSHQTYVVIGHLVMEMSDEVGIRYTEAYNGGRYEGIEWMLSLTDWNELIDVDGDEVPRFVETDDY